MNPEQGEWNPSVDIELAWKDFLVGVMAHTVVLCRWLGRKHGAGRCMVRNQRPGKQLYNAAVAWRWVFWGPESELTLEETCLHLGVNAPQVRSRILKEIGAGRDINTLVAKVLDLAEVQYAERSRTEHGGDTVDWSALRHYRSVYPVGSSPQDFCRVALGRAE
jgi:hypothetical protein